MSVRCCAAICFRCTHSPIPSETQIALICRSHVLLWINCNLLINVFEIQSIEWVSTLLPPYKEHFISRHKTLIDYLIVVRSREISILCGKGLSLEHPYSITLNIGNEKVQTIGHLQLTMHGSDHRSSSLVFDEWVVLYSVYLSRCPCNCRDKNLLLRANSTVTRVLPMNESMVNITSISISLKSASGGDRQLIRQVVLFDIEQQKRSVFAIDSQLSVFLFLVWHCAHQTMIISSSNFVENK